MLRVTWAITLLTIVMLVGLGVQIYLAIFPVLAPGTASSGADQQLPTAAEAFQLRSTCVKLGEKLLEENAIGSGLTQSQVAHYDARSNRCYVEHIVHMTDLSKLDEYHARYLKDGQTKELLAVARVEKGKKLGTVYDKQRHPSGELTNAGWDDAGAYINKIMANERREPSNQPIR
jgi:hypothetical protein